MDEIVIIDDGVNSSCFNIGSVKNDLEIDDALTIKMRKTDTNGHITHGTYCAGVIRKYAPDAVLSSLKILDSSGEGCVDKLVAALKWCTENGIRLVNISLGSVDPKDVPLLKKASLHAVNKGVMMVAALSNDDLITYPAAFSFVMGVQCQSCIIENSPIPELTKDRYIYHSFGENGADVTACGEHRLFDEGQGALITPNSNSMAAAVMTTQIYHLMNLNPAISMNHLKKEMVRGDCLAPPKKK